MMRTNILTKFKIKMEISVKYLFLLRVLIAGLGLILDGTVRAQTFRNLHNFSGSDGYAPQSGVILSGNTLYGTTLSGGSLGEGTVYAVKTDGTGFITLYDFDLGSSDGANPRGGVILSGDTLYGTTANGYDGGAGAVFSVDTDGTNFTTLQDFDTSSIGFGAYAGLVLSGDTLYGTTEVGSSDSGDGFNSGTVFSVNTNGMGFKTLHIFSAATSSGLPHNYQTNSDGAAPEGALVLSGNTLYGTTEGGGTSGSGTVFRIDIDGSSFTNLHSFTACSGPSGPNPTNSDGYELYCGLVLSGNTLYGTTYFGGSGGRGTVFAVNTDGTDFTILHSFTALSDGNSGTNGDGAEPFNGLILSGNTMYGTANYGGIWGEGTVYALNIDGAGFTNLYNFTTTTSTGPPYYYGTNSDGVEPCGRLILSGITLYGTTENGGTLGFGTVFSLSFAPQLTVFPTGSSLILTWPTNKFGFDYSGFTLQSATQLLPAAWNTVSSAPVVINGQFIVTNLLSGTQQFYRLRQ